MKGVCVLKVGVFCCYFLLLFCPQEFADWVCCVLESWGLWLLLFGSPKLFFLSIQKDVEFDGSDI